MRRRYVAAAAIVTVTLFAALAWAGSALVVAHELSEPQAFIALGSHEWERLPAVARLARQAPNAVVLLTRPLHPSPANCHLCPQRVAWLTALGTPAERIVLLRPRVENTRDEALVVAEYVRAHAIRRLVVVTSPYHTRRAAAVFASVLGGGVEVGIQPATPESPAQPTRWWAAPYDRAYVAYEWTALAWYALRYGVSPMVSIAVTGLGEW